MAVGIEGIWVHAMLSAGIVVPLRRSLTVDNVLLSNNDLARLRSPQRVLMAQHTPEATRLAETTCSDSQTDSKPADPRGS